MFLDLAPTLLNGLFQFHFLQIFVLDISLYDDFEHGVGIGLDQLQEIRVHARRLIFLSQSGAGRHRQQAEGQDERQKDIE